MAFEDINFGEIMKPLGKRACSYLEKGAWCCLAKQELLALN